MKFTLTFHISQTTQPEVKQAHTECSLTQCPSPGNIIYKAEENIMTSLHQQFSSQPIYAAEDEDWGINHRGIDTSGLSVNSSEVGGQLN